MMQESGVWIMLIQECFHDFVSCTNSTITASVPSEMSRSRISQAKMVGFSLLYCSILDTTAGVATFGLLPPMSPGGRSVPVIESNSFVA